MKYKRPIYQEPGLVKKQQSNLFNTQTTQTTDTSDEEKVNIFREKLAKDREERLTQRPDTFTINPLQNFDFSSDVDDFGNPVERDSSTTNFLDSLWNSKNTEEKNKIWELIRTIIEDESPVHLVTIGERFRTAYGIGQIGRYIAKEIKDNAK